MAGSSGIGVFDEAQSPQDAFRILDEIASSTPVIQAELGPVHRFPNTDIFVFTLLDETPFVDLHKRIKKAGLLFKPCPFPYRPHCTFRSLAPKDTEEESQIFSLSVPGDFTLTSMAVYGWAADGCTGYHRVPLGE